MAYNLDFSAWNESRRATANSILAQAQAQAEAKRARTQTYAKMISGLGQVAAGLFKEKDESKDMAIDPMQVASAGGFLDESGKISLTPEQLDKLMKRFRGGF